MNKYQSALLQMCLQCKTKRIYCNKKKCNRFIAISELVEKATKELKENERAQ